MHTAHFLHGAPKAAYRAHPRDASQSPSQSQARIGESIASTRNLATGQCRLRRSASQAAMATALAASLNPPGLRCAQRCVAISGTGVCCDFRNGGGVLRFPERGEIATRRCVAISAHTLNCMHSGVLRCDAKPRLAELGTGPLCMRCCDALGF